MSWYFHHIQLSTLPHRSTRCQCRRLRFLGRLSGSGGRGGEGAGPQQPQPLGQSRRQWRSGGTGAVSRDVVLTTTFTFRCPKRSRRWSFCSSGMCSKVQLRGFVMGRKTGLEAGWAGHWLASLGFVITGQSCHLLSPCALALVSAQDAAVVVVTQGVCSGDSGRPGCCCHLAAQHLGYLVEAAA